MHFVCTSDRMPTGGNIDVVVRSGYQFTYETTESGLKVDCKVYRKLST